MLLCLSTGADLTPVMEYCRHHDLFIELAEIPENESVKTVLAKNRSMANYDFVLLYCPSPADWTVTGADVVDSAAYIRKFYHARLIVFAPDSPETASLFGALADMDLRELVAVSEETDLAAELAECLSADGKGFADIVQHRFTAHVDAARSYVRPEFTIPESLRLTVGVAGAGPRTGVTTQAFSLYHALAALGFTPCIVDIRQSFIESLLLLYADEAEHKGSVVGIQGMDFSPDIQAGTGHNVFLYDLGELTDDCAGALRACDLRILCAGAKPWELPWLAAKEDAYGADIDIAVFSFASEREQQMVREFELSRTVAFAPWNPDIWRHSNREWHEQLLIPFLKEQLSS